MSSTFLDAKAILSYINCFEAPPSIQSIDKDVWSKRVANSDPCCVSVNQDKEVQNSIFNMMANSFIIAQSQTLLQSRGARILPDSALSRAFGFPFEFLFF
jgi:hypothetical protein